MKLCITGLNHRTAPVAVREQLAFDHQTLGQALRDLKLRPGLVESMILSTCNRVEIVVASEENIDPRPLVEDFLATSRRMERHSLSQYLYQLQGRDAIRHLFRVASSLDSMVVGEPQILGQLKSAYVVAKAEGTLSGHLDLLLTRAFSVAKRVRSETEIGQNAVSVSYAAVELARDIFGSLQNKKVLLIGAGKMSELAARHLQRSGASQIYVSNRTRSRAEEMAIVFHGKVVDYDRLLAALPEMDIVITSSGASEPILRKEEMRKVIEARRNKPMFLIDIAVPRNIDPRVNELDGLFVYDIDDLQRVVERNLRDRLSEAEQADVIISEEVERVETYLRSREAVPTIVSLQEQLEQLRYAEVQRVRGRLGALSPQQEEAIEALTKGLINKIAHGPIAELRRNAGSAEGGLVVDVIRRVFRLERQ